MLMGCHGILDDRTPTGPLGKRQQDAMKMMRKYSKWYSESLKHVLTNEVVSTPSHAMQTKSEHLDGCLM